MLGCSVARGILVPWPGIEPISPAMQGRFLIPATQEVLGKEILKKFIYNSIKNKILRNEFIEVKNLKYTQIYSKEIKDLKKWKDKSCSWMRKLILLWQQQLPDWLADLIQLLSESESAFLVEINKLILKFIWNVKRPRITRAMLKKKNEEDSLLISKLIKNSSNGQYGADLKTNVQRAMEQNWEPKNKPRTENPKTNPELRTQKQTQNWEPKNKPRTENPKTNPHVHPHFLPSVWE